MAKLRIKMVDLPEPVTPNTVTLSVPALQICKHELVDDQGFCPTCGMEVPKINYKGEWGDRHTRAKAERSIMKDLDPYNLPDEIKNKANNVFVSIAPATHRGKKRKQLLFFCLFTAYKELGIHVDPKTIAQLINMDLGGMNKSISMFSEIQTGYRVRKHIVTCVDIVPDYCEKVGISVDAVSQVTGLASEMLTKCPNLRERYPQTVAAGILRYYMSINGLLVDELAFAKTLCLSEATISQSHKLIQQIDND